MNSEVRKKRLVIVESSESFRFEASVRVETRQMKNVTTFINRYT